MITKKSNYIYIVSAILVAFTILYFIVPKKSNSGTTIGAICDMTGVIAEYGKWVRNGIMLASDCISEYDSSFNVIIEDSQSSVSSARNAFEKLTCLDKVKYVICGCNSSSVMSIDAQNKEYRSIIFSGVASTPNLKQTGKYVFSNRVLGIDEVETVAFQIDKLGIHTVAVVALNNEAGQPYIDAFENTLKNTDVNLLSKILVDPGTNEFRTEIVKLKKMNPDAVLLVTPTEQSINFMKQSNTQGFVTEWFGISSLKTDGFLRNGGNIIENMIIASENPDNDSIEYIDFVQKYRNRFHEDPTIYSINGYEATMILYELTKRYGSDSESVYKALSTESFSTISGDVSFSPEGIIVNKKVDLFVVKNNQFVLMEKNQL